MIVLNSTTDKIQIVLGGTITTNQLNCFANYRDITTTAYTPARTVLNTNNTTAVDIIPAPASSTQRVVDYISVFNNDTASATVTIRFNDNGTTYNLFKTTLDVGEKLEYQEGKGFSVITDSGAIKTSLNQGNSPVSSLTNMVVLSTDVINNNAVANTMQNVTGLSFPVNTGSTYKFRAVVSYTSALSTTGSRWSISGPTFSSLSYTSQYTLSATTITFNSLSAYDTPVASNSNSILVGNQAVIEGFITPSNTGNVIIRFASEVANSAITAKAGSTLEWIQVL